MNRALDSVADQLVEVKVFRQIGFKAVLAWHYLVLFSPLLIGTMQAGFASLFFTRQLVLYLALGATFAFIALPGRVCSDKGKATLPLYATGCVGLAAVAISAVAVFALDAWLIPITAVLGISEGFLMFFWLRYYQLAVTQHLYRSLAIDKICGALVAALICVMQYPFSMIAMVFLPAAAAVSLIASWKTLRYPSERPLGGEGPERPLPAKGKRASRFLATILSTFVFAFVFGMLQGSYVVDGTVLLMATSPLIFLGIAACGLILLAIPEDTGDYASIDTIHRLGLVFFVFGIVGLPFLEDWGFIASETAIMIGFTLFDFGALAIGISMTKRLRIRGSFFIGGGRSFTYFGLAFGLLIGYGVTQSIKSQMVFGYVLGGIAILLLVATVMAPFRKTEAGGLEGAQAAVLPDDGLGTTRRAEGEGASSLTASTQGDRQAPQQTPWKKARADVAKVYRLSPRETEIFFLIAKGRNAEYVQQKLVISTHTAKTHISNIYHKLGVHSSQEMLDLIEEFREGTTDD